MEKIATKTAVPYMNKDNCNSIPVMIPSLPEQTKIATFLTAIDDKIAQLTQKGELLGRYKQGIMQQIFSQQLRFRDEDGQEFPEWEEKSLGEVMKVPKKIKPIEIDKSKILTVKLHLKGILKNDNTDALSIGATNYFVRNKGQFIYGKQNLFNGAFGIIPDAFDGYLSSGDVPALDIDNNKLNADFFIYFLGRKNFYTHLEGIASGSGSKRIHENTLLNVEIYLPSIEEQTKIAAFLTAIDDKIAHNQAQLAALKQYKQGLLQRMFV